MHTGNTPSAGPAESAPTFPKEVESLLHHLKIGAARASADALASGAFPHIENYKIESEIGRGGMGVVYRARHTKLRQTVAVKMILASEHATDTEVVRFLAEAEAIAAVKHSNVVRVNDLGSANGRPYFVMEYVNGGNLAQRLKAGRIAPRDAARLLEPVARGVQAAHEADIVHRDLKPANILLQVERRSGSRDGTPDSAEKTRVESPKVESPKVESHEVEESGSTLDFLPAVRVADVIPKVSDFGLAKRLSTDLTRSEAVLGTPQYMAPEQAGGKAKFVGPGADVYALGVILYECLTGSVPFKSDEVMSLIRQVLEDPPQPPRKQVPGVPRDLELICLKCLEKEPHHRYLSATDLADDLQRFLNNEPVSVRPIGALTRALRWSKRRPAAAGLVALAVLLLLVVPPSLVWVQWRLDQRKANEETAQQLAASAQEARILAERAEGAAQLARAAAEREAAARELFGLQKGLRTLTNDRPLGWTATNRNDLPRAAKLAASDPQALLELRSVAATGVLAADLFPVEPAEPVVTGSALATDPKTGWVAVGEFKARSECRVHLIEPATGRTVRRFVYQVQFLSAGQDGTRALAFSPDGTRLFVGTRGSQVIRFDLDKAGDKPATVWPASASAVEQLAVSPDGKTVYGLCRPEVPVFAWDAETGKAREPFIPNENQPITSFAVLPSGELLAGNGQALYQWTAERKLVRTIPNKTNYRLAPTGGPLLLLADTATLVVSDRETGEPTDRFTDPRLRRVTHEEWIQTIVVHPSGAFVATASGDVDRTIKVWQLASGRLVGTVLAPGTERIALAWSGDGKFLLATAVGRVERWKFEPSAALGFACVSGNPLGAAALAPGDGVVAVGSHTRSAHDVFIGAPGKLAEVARVPDDGGDGRVGVAVAADGTLAVTTHRPGIFAWKPGTPVPAPAFTKQGSWCPRFAPDGALWAVVNSREVHRYDPATKARREWRNILGEVVSGVSSIDALTVGRTVAVAGGREGTVFLLDPLTCEQIKTLRAPGDPVLSVALAPDESLLVAGTQNGKLRAVRVADKIELPAVPAHPGGMTAASFNADGTLLATGGRDRTVRLWRRTGNQFEPLLAVEHLSGVVRELQFDPTNSRLLVLLDHEHAVRIWDVDRLKAQLAEVKLGW
jgi:serine/threonine protein kinase/WD40 repeat protein